MPLEAIKSIKDAEELAQKKVMDAGAAAKQKISDAEKAAAARVAGARTQGQAEADAMMKNTEKRAAEDARALSQTTHNRCAAIRAHAEKKMDTAAELIVRRVVKG